MKFLKSMWQLFLEELKKKVVQKIIRYLGLFFLSWLFPPIRNYLYLPLWKLATTPIVSFQVELGLFGLLLGLFGISALLCLGYYIKVRSIKKPKQWQYFEYRQLHWRYNIVSEEVDYFPFCPEHEKQYIEFREFDSMIGWMEYLICPDRPPNTELETLSRHDFRAIYDAAQSHLQSTLHPYKIRN